MIVWFPPARRDGSPPPAWILELARVCGAFWWDIGQEMTAGTIHLSDGVHMDATSATITVAILMNGLSHASDLPDS